jgi:hypothetical protein
LSLLLICPVENGIKMGLKGVRENFRRSVFVDYSISPWSPPGWKRFTYGFVFSWILNYSKYKSFLRGQWYSSFKPLIRDL